MTHRVVLHIGRLVLRGVDPADADTVAASLRSGLQALLADGGGALVAEGSAARRRPAPLVLPDGGDAVALGRAVAASIATPTPCPAPPAGRQA